MGNKGKAGDFKKNDPRINKKGRPRIPEEIKKIRKLTKETVDLLLSKFLGMSPTELSKIARDKNTTAHELFVIKIIQLGINKGDHQRLNFLHERLIGKVINNQDIKVTGSLTHSQLLDKIKEGKDK